MRKCVRCGTEMVENVTAAVQGYSYGLMITTDHKWFPRHLSKIRAAVCPDCGEVSLFINPEDLKK